MAQPDKHSLFNIARIYEVTQRFYSALPYHYFKGGYSFPAWHYYFEVTRRCNLRCKMCQYIEWLENEPAEKQKEGELTTGEWHSVIEQLHRFSFVTFTGGEPLVRKDFIELLEHAGLKARTHVISNTTMLTGERSVALVALAPKRLGGRGLNFMGTSIEGPGDRHDEIRRLEGAYERSISGVQRLCEHRERTGKQCPMIHVTTVIQKGNVDVLHHLPKLMKDAGVDVLNFVTETRMFELPGLGEVDPATYKLRDLQFPQIDRATLAEALDKTIAAAKACGIELRLPRMPIKDLLNYYDGGFKLGDFECRNAWNTLFVGRTGDVYPCWIRRVGNIRENSLQELWNNATMRDFRQTCQKRLFAPCPGCCFIEHKSERNALASPDMT